MELHQLRYVVEVAAVASFTRAAERCFVTQSALSHQIAALERELGERLFVRSSRNVRPTEAGEAFLTHARAAVLAAESAREAVAAVSGTVVGTLRLGMIPTVTAVSVPVLISRFRALHPDARVELSVGNSETLSMRVRDGELDVALLGLRADAAPRGVAVRELAREALILVMPARHRLAARRRVSLEDLADEVFADFPSGTAGRAQSDSAFTTAGVRRDVAFEADSAELILALVSTGQAVSLLPHGVVAPSEELRTAKVSQGPVRVEYIAWNGAATRSVADAFLRVVDAATSRGADEAGPEESSEPAPSAS